MLPFDNLLSYPAFAMVGFRYLTLAFSYQIDLKVPGGYHAEPWCEDQPMAGATTFQWRKQIEVRAKSEVGSWWPHVLPI